MELVKITQNAVTGNQTVDARELHTFLESKQRFADWIKNRIREYGFVENEDYFTNHKFMIRGENSNLGSKITNYDLTLDCAKELAMVERNEKGRQVRQYFIACEKQLRATHQNYVQHTAQINQEIAIYLREVLDKVLELSQKFIEAQEDRNKTTRQKYRKVIQLDYSWKEELDAMLADISKIVGNGNFTTNLKWLIDQLPLVRKYGHRQELKQYLNEVHNADVFEYQELRRYKQYIGYVQKGDKREPVYVDTVGRPININFKYNWD